MNEHPHMMARLGSGNVTHWQNEWEWSAHQPVLAELQKMLEEAGRQIPVMQTEGTSNGV